ncbi:MCE family protein [Rhodococcus sp. NPDC058521]|uniref:MCE family protein n=1 Tax=Rhodococcus sp. NPDC058521 TaxID=3346536 RepID=UPI0036565BBA
MSSRSTSLRGPALRLVLLLGVGILATVVVANTLTVPVSGATKTYSARFTDIEGLGPGNDVTLAGVRVGQVESVRFEDAGNGGAEALVEFEVESDRVLTSNVEAAVRYGDMLGVRYVALTNPVAADVADPDDRLLPGSTIPVERTTPPVDLTALINGFEPLFDAIDPADVNQLARTVVDAFQGQGSTIDSLLVRLAEIASNLQDHEAVFTQLVANLENLLGAVDERGAEVERLIGGLADLGATAADRNDQLIALLDDGSAALHSIVTLMASSLEPVDRTIDRLNATTGSWIPNTPTFETTMTDLPRFAGAINQIADYGGWLNLYMCNFTLLADDAEVDIFGAAHSEVCR